MILLLVLGHAVASDPVPGLKEARELVTGVSDLLKIGLETNDWGQERAACVARARSSNDALLVSLDSMEGRYEADATAALKEMARAVRGASALLGYAELQCLSPGQRSGSTTVELVHASPTATEVDLAGPSYGSGGEPWVPRIDAAAEPMQRRIDEAPWTSEERLASALMAWDELSDRAALGHCGATDKAADAAWVAVESMHAAIERGSEAAQERARKKAARLLEQARARCGG